MTSSLSISTTNPIVITWFNTTKGHKRRFHKNVADERETSPPQLQQDTRRVSSASIKLLSRVGWICLISTSAHLTHENHQQAKETLKRDIQWKLYRIHYEYFRASETIQAWKKKTRNFIISAHHILLGLSNKKFWEELIAYFRLI
jgi:hypothetical protein